MDDEGGDGLAGINSAYPWAFQASSPYELFFTSPSQLIQQYNQMWLTSLGHSKSLLIFCYDHACRDLINLPAGGFFLVPHPIPNPASSKEKATQKHL